MIRFFPLVASKENSFWERGQLELRALFWNELGMERILLQELLRVGVAGFVECST
jgi:hypothetical protein